MTDNFKLMIKYVLPVLITAVGSGVVSVKIAKYQQEPRNSQGAIGYEVAADRINKLEFQEEQTRQELALIAKLCAPAVKPAASKVLKLSAITVQGLTPLQRVPSRLEHLPEH